MDLVGWNGGLVVWVLCVMAGVVWSQSTLARIFACLALVAATLGVGFLALVATGGDSAFANESGWVYAPYLVAVTLTFAAVIASIVWSGRPSSALTAAAALAYVGTVAYWFTAFD